MNYDLKRHRVVSGGVKNLQIGMHHYYFVPPLHEERVFLK